MNGEKQQIVLSLVSAFYTQTMHIRRKRKRRLRQRGVYFMDLYTILLKLSHSPTIYGTKLNTFYCIVCTEKKRTNIDVDEDAEFMNICLTRAAELTK